MFKSLLLAGVMALTPMAALADGQPSQGDYIEDTLRYQQYQIYQLNRQRQVQANQREIERLQDSLIETPRRQEPQVIVNNQQPGVLSTLLQTAVIGGALWLNSPYARADAWSRYNDSYYRREYYRDGKRYRRCGHYYC